jgi:hypothetical protein
MQHNDMDRGIDVIQFCGVLFLRWRVIVAGLGAALAIAFITGAMAGNSTAEANDPIPVTYLASAVYSFVTAGDTVEIPAGEVASLRSTKRGRVVRTIPVCLIT